MKQASAFGEMIAPRDGVEETTMEQGLESRIELANVVESAGVPQTRA
jgi:hypothetical protein